MATPQLLEEYFQRCLEIATGIDDPFEQSFFALVHLSYLPLIKHNLCPLSFINVPTQSYAEGLLGVHELHRIELLRDIYL